MISKAQTVSAYLAALPDERRSVVEAVRQVILKNIDKGFEEGIQYGMIGYYVPHKLYPNGYHCDPKQPLPFCGLAAQKSHFALYLGSLNIDPTFDSWFTQAWTDAGKKLDMGKGCVRFKKLDGVPLDVVAEAFRRVKLDAFIRGYEKATATNGVRAASPTKPTTSKTSTTRTSKAAKATTKSATSRTASSDKKPVVKTSVAKATGKSAGKVVKKAAKKLVALKTGSDEKIVVENINTPGRQSRVDAQKYRAMRKVLLKVLPKRQPGLTQAEMLAAVQPHLPQTLWPSGEKSAWWLKTVQLDLEAKGLVVRTVIPKPTRWVKM